MTKRFLTVTYGCQMNKHDSDLLTELLIGAGFQPAVDRDSADVIIFNTCTVRRSADEKFFGQVGALKEHCSMRPETIIAVGGCLAQDREDEIRRRAPHVDVIFGTYNFTELPWLLEEATARKSVVLKRSGSLAAVGHGRTDGGMHISQPEKREQVRSAETAHPVADEFTFNDAYNIRSRTASRRASLSENVTAMVGCDNFCSYCIVPYVRGREVSRPSEDILAEIRSLAQRGTKEVTLLGQNVNSYGMKESGHPNFAQLLEMAAEVDGIKRLRFTTSHPRDFSDELIGAIAKTPKVCRYIHLPFQAGSTRVLRLMRRGYSKEDYLELVAKIRSRVPDVVLSADVIVGFPGETKADFQDTMEVVEQVKFDQLFTFLYSPRARTKANELEDDVSREEKLQRFLRLTERQKEISLGVNQAYQDKIVKVLVEGPSKKDPEMLTGRTEGNKIVHFSGAHELIGQVICVKITEVRSWYLRGSVVQESIVGR